MSTWGEIITIGQAEQVDAPAILPLPNKHLIAAWIDADETGVFQVIHSWVGEIPPDATPLTRPATYAQSQFLAPAVSNRIHLLWLDVDPDDFAGGIRLWSMVITPDLGIERGPIQLSDRRTAHFSAVSTDNNGLWVVWSGGLQAEPSLYVNQIDSAGRPQFPEPIVYGGDWPVLTYMSDTLYLFWLGVLDRQIYRATLREGAPENITAIAPSVDLNRGDRLVNLSAGVDTSHVYLLWNIVRSDGEPQTWYASGPPNVSQWAAPVRMGIELLATPFETSYNGGAGQNIIAGNRWLSWTAPMKIQSDGLAVAAEVNEVLGIVYLQAGEIIGYQHVVSLEQPGLIGLPSLATDRNRHLYLAWSWPTENGCADLNLTMTR